MHPFPIKLLLTSPLIVYLRFFIENLMINIKLFYWVYKYLII